MSGSEKIDASWMDQTRVSRREEDSVEEGEAKMKQEPAGPAQCANPRAAMLACN